MDNEKKCSKTPLQVRRNLSFLVDVSKLRDWQDVKSDMNGVYHITLRVATWTVQVGASNHVDILEKKKVELASDNDFHVHVHSKKNKAGLCRSIFYLLDLDEKIVNSTCLLQYSLTDRACEEGLIFMCLPMETAKAEKHHSTHPKRVLWKPLRESLLHVRRPLL